MKISTLALTGLLASPCPLVLARERDDHLRGDGGRRLVEGGTPVQDSEYPSHVRAFEHRRGVPHCGGTLIGKRVVIMAAHCHKPGVKPGEGYELGGIAAGYDPDGVFSLGERYEIDTIIKHPDLDLMLVKTKDDVVANGRAPAKIRQDILGGFEPGVEVNIAGGGSVDHSASGINCVAEGFNKLDVEVRKCPSGWDDTVLCAYNGSSRICNTDSGTGVFQVQWPSGWFGTGLWRGEDVLVGVVASDYIGSELGNDGKEGTWALCQCVKNFSSLVRIGTDDVLAWIYFTMIYELGVQGPEIV